MVQRRAVSQIYQNAARSPSSAEAGLDENDFQFLAASSPHSCPVCLPALWHCSSPVRRAAALGCRHGLRRGACERGLGYQHERFRRCSRRLLAVAALEQLATSGCARLSRHPWIRC